MSDFSGQREKNTELHHFRPFSHLNPHHQPIPPPPPPRRPRPHKKKKKKTLLFFLKIS